MQQPTSAPAQARHSTGPWQLPPAHLGAAAARAARAQSCAGCRRAPPLPRAGAAVAAAALSSRCWRRHQLPPSRPQPQQPSATAARSRGRTQDACRLPTRSPQQRQQARRAAERLIQLLARSRRARLAGCAGWPGAAAVRARLHPSRPASAPLQLQGLPAGGLCARCGWSACCPCCPRPRFRQCLPPMQQVHRRAQALPLAWSCSARLGGCARLAAAPALHLRLMRLSRWRHLLRELPAGVLAGGWRGARRPCCCRCLHARPNRAGPTPAWLRRRRCLRQAQGTQSCCAYHARRCCQCRRRRPALRREGAGSGSAAQPLSGPAPAPSRCCGGSPSLSGRRPAAAEPPPARCQRCWGSPQGQQRCHGSRRWGC